MQSDQSATDPDRRCTNCGTSVEDAPYELWLFHTCRSCALDATPKRWGDTGTARKWRYFPRWHLTEHPDRDTHWRTKEVATDGGADTCGVCGRELGTIDYDTGTCECGVPITGDDARPTVSTDGGTVEDADTHRSEGVGMDTVVRCSETGQAYGPGTIDPTDPAFCPYCGDSVDDDQHRLAARFDEVFCEHTSQSTWRYCPGCGEEVDGAI